MAVEEKLYLSTRECAAMFGLSVPFLMADRRKHHIGIPYVKIGKKVLYGRRQVDEFLNSKTVASAAEAGGATSKEAQ